MVLVVHKILCNFLIVPEDILGGAWHQYFLNLPGGPSVQRTLRMIALWPDEAAEISDILKEGVKNVFMVFVFFSG